MVEGLELPLLPGFPSSGLFLDVSVSIGVGSRPLGPLFPFSPAFTVLDGCEEGAGGSGRASTVRAGLLPVSVLLLGEDFNSFKIFGLYDDMDYMDYMDCTDYMDYIGDTAFMSYMDYIDYMGYTD